MASFGRYTLVRRVGTGGMAEIWKAKAQGPAGFEKILAIKKVLPHLAEDREFIDMFVAEAKLVATLVHPNIVQVFDFGQVGRTEYFIAMEYMPGANLALILRRLTDRGARLPVEVALFIAVEACKGLGYAHSKTDYGGKNLGIVHRDVSPQNVLVSFSGEVKVTDFGIAKVESALPVTAEGHVRGKLAYMSPEQANTRPLDNRSDLFSLGVVLYELLHGRRLFTGSSASEIFAKVTSFRPPQDADLPDLPPDVRQILGTILQTDPEERYQDATELEHALNAALGPQAIVQARHALGSMVQRLFEEERALEMTPDPGVLPGEDPDGSAPTVIGRPPEPEDLAMHPDVPATAGEPGISHSGSRRVAVPHAGASAGAPTTVGQTPSGLTLNRSAVRAVRGNDAIAPSDSTKGPGPASRDTMRTLALGVGGVLLAGAALWIAAILGYRLPLGERVAAVLPTPYETPIVQVLTPVPTPTSAPVSTPAPTVAATRIAAATPAATPIARVTAVPRATPRPPAVPAAIAGRATLTVNANPWVQVFVDGKEATPETPLRRHKLPAGRHVIRFVNPGLKFSWERPVSFPADAEIKVFVDVKANSVRMQ